MIILYKRLIESGLPVQSGIYDTGTEIKCHTQLTPEQQTLFDQIVAQWQLDLPAMIADEALSEQIAAGAESQALAVPGWARWTEAPAESWYSTNISGPLTTGRANLPATLTLASTRVVILALLDILDKIAVALLAITRMQIALRNKQWPNLQNRNGS